MEHIGTIIDDIMVDAHSAEAIRLKNETSKLQHHASELLIEWMKQPIKVDLAKYDKYKRLLKKSQQFVEDNYESLRVANEV